MTRRRLPPVTHTHALFADQSQSILDNLLVLLDQSSVWNCSDPERSDLQYKWARGRMKRGPGNVRYLGHFGEYILTQSSTMRARSTACGRLRSAGIAANCSRSASSQSHIPSEPSPCSPDLPQYCTSSWVYGSSEWFIALAERRHQRCIYVSFQMVEVAAARQHSGKPCH